MAADPRDQRTVPGSVLVAGDFNLDLVLTGDVIPRFGQVEQLVDAGELVLGGSAAIVASGLARLGVPTRFVGRIGDDAFGRIALEHLGATGVDVSAVEVDPALPTGLSVILSTPSDRAILTLLGTIPTLTAEQVERAAEGTSAVHVASYFLQPALAGELPALFRDLRARGIRTSLDTNWDPAEQWSGLAEVLPHVDVLLPNLEELRSVGAALGADSSLSDAAIARHIAAIGPTVAVKAGADGGWSVAGGRDTASAPGLRVDVVDTTGAGDSFDAGYLAATAHGIGDEHERLGWATAAGSLSTLARGGTAGQADLEALTASLTS